MSKHFCFEMTGPDQTSKADATPYVPLGYQIGRPKLRESEECVRDRERIPLTVQNWSRKLEQASN
jgi:hypothetical protein